MNLTAGGLVFVLGLIVAIFAAFGKHLLVETDFQTGGLLFVCLFLGLLLSPIIVYRFQAGPGA